MNTAVGCSQQALATGSKTAGAREDSVYGGNATRVIGVDGDGG